MLKITKQNPNKGNHQFAMGHTRTRKFIPFKTKNPFDSYDIYITLDNNKMYQISQDFSKREVNKVKILKEFCNGNYEDNRVIILHKKQFELIKKHLLNENSPDRIDEDAAVFFYNIGFITEEELNDYLVNIEQKQRRIQ